MKVAPDRPVNGDPFLTAAEYARLAGLCERRCQRWAKTGRVAGARKTIRPGLLGEVWEAPLSSWEAIRRNPPRRGRQTTTRKE